MVESSPSRLRHPDSATGQGPRARRLGHSRNDYLELRNVTTVPDMTTVTVMTAVHAMLYRNRYDLRDRRELCDRSDWRDHRPRRPREEAPRRFISFTRRSF